MLVKTLNFLFSECFLSSVLPNLLGLVAFVAGALCSLLALFHFILSADLWPASGGRKDKGQECLPQQAQLTYSFDTLWPQKGQWNRALGVTCF